MTEDLAARVEGLTGPCKEIDCRVHLSRYPGIKIMTDGGGWRGERSPSHTLATAMIEDWQGDWRDFALQINAPAYTSDLSAAMKLVPEGWAIETLTWWPPTPEEASNTHGGQSRAGLFEQSLSDFHKGQRTWGHSSGDHRAEAKATTPALALAAAALRARGL